MRVDLLPATLPQPTAPPLLLLTTNKRVAGQAAAAVGFALFSFGLLPHTATTTITTTATAAAAGPQQQQCSGRQATRARMVTL